MKLEFDIVRISTVIGLFYIHSVVSSFSVICANIWKNAVLPRQFLAVILNAS